MRSLILVGSLLLLPLCAQAQSQEPYPATIPIQLSQNQQDPGAQASMVPRTVPVAASPARSRDVGSMPLPSDDLPQKDLIQMNFGI